MKLKYWAADMEKNHWEPHNEVESKTRPSALKGLEKRTFQFRVDPLSQCATLPK